MGFRQKNPETQSNIIQITNNCLAIYSSNCFTITDLILGLMEKKQGKNGVNLNIIVRNLSIHFFHH